MAGETQVSKAVREAINQSRLAFVWRNQSGTAHGGRMHLAPEGSPDLIGWMMDGSGRFLGVECKSPHGKTSARRTELQRAWALRIQVVLAVSLTVSSVQEAIDGLRAAKR